MRRGSLTQGLQLTGFRLPSLSFEVVVEYHDFGLADQQLAMV
jgi:hypothetical protein